MIYIAIDKLEPNAASTNHFLAIIKRFAERNVPFKLVSFLPNTNMDEEACLYDYINVAIDCPIKQPNIRRVWNKFYQLTIYRNRLRRFAASLTEKDTVFAYSEYHCLESFFKSGCHLYLEFTEHPDLHSFMFRNQKERNSFFETIVNVDGLFVITTALKEFYVSKNVAPAKITLVNMIVDSNRFNEVKKTNVDYPYIAYCGTASNKKDGVNLLLMAFALIAPDFPSLKLLIIGKTPTRSDSYENLSLIDRLGIKEKVVFSGTISRENMPQVLKNASVLALARPNSIQAQHGFPTKLGEYLLTKNPVVVTKTGDISLFLKDGESAYLVEPNDEIAFANKLKYVLNNHDEAKRIGHAGYNVAIKYFNYKTEADKIINRIIHV